MDTTSPADSTAADLPARLLEWGICVVVIAAPLPFGSVVPWARGVLEGFCALLAVIWVGRCLAFDDGRPTRWVGLSLAGLLTLGILQIVPLPRAVVGAVQPVSESILLRVERPTDVVAVESELLGPDSQPESSISTLSLDPVSTASGLRTGIALAVLLLCALTVAATRGLRNLLIALALSAGFQGLYGLLVVASGHDKIWNVPKQFSLGSATGTWVNPSHYSGYLAAALPVLLAWFLYRVHRWAALHRENGARRAVISQRLARGFGGRSALIGLAFLLGCFGLLTSFSRAGILLAIAALSVVVMQFFRRRRAWVGIAILLTIAFAAAIPLLQMDPDRLVDKYSRSAEELLEGNRRIVWNDTLHLFADAPWVGTGFGTFEAVYPLYRSPEVRLLYRHTHNDLLQFLGEGGLLGLALLLPLGIAVLVSLFRGIRGAGGILLGGVAAGLSTTLLHSVVDFPFHLPANAALAVIFAGILLGTSWPTED